MTGWSTAQQRRNPVPAQKDCRPVPWMASATICAPCQFHGHDFDCEVRAYGQRYSERRRINRHDEREQRQRRHSHVERRRGLESARGVFERTDDVRFRLLGFGGRGRGIAGCFC